MSFMLHVTWKGKTAIISLPVADPTLDELGQRMEKELGASFETLKLLVPGRKGPIAPARQREQAASEAGLTNGCKALLMASKAEDVTLIRAARDLPGMRGFEDELRQAARRRRIAARFDANPQPPRAEFTFGAYESWQRPGLHPPPAEALKLLHRLAGDPGILGVMSSHRYSVGLLSEMPPEGKVGVSPVCILGVNIGAGREISLRLRTDDLKGFRKYERIRETLIHELAHMEYGEHDSDFKRLNSQLGRECAAINARYVGGHSLLVDEGRRVAIAAGSSDGPSELDDPSLLEGAAAVMAATARLSGKTLRQLAAASGGSPAAPAGAAVAAAAAAMVAAALPSGAAAAAGGGVAAGGDGGSSSEGVDGEGGDEVREFEHFDAATERAEAAARRLGSMDEPPPPSPPAEGPGQGAGSGAALGSGPGASCDGCGNGGGIGGEVASPCPPEAESAWAAASGDAVPVGVAALRAPTSGAAATPSLRVGVGVGEQMATATASDPMEVDSGVDASARAASAAAAAVAAQPQASTAADDAAAPAPPPPSGAAAATSGAAARACHAATADGARGTVQSGQRSPPRRPVPLIKLTLQLPEGLVAGGDGAATGGGDTLDAAQAKLRAAWGALAQMAAAVSCNSAAAAAAVVPTAEDMVTALDTLETLLGNAVHFPTEDRYRRVRLGNGAFQRRVGWLPGGVELLRVAGFVTGGGADGGPDAVLRLRRNDPGLLWLVLSAVREAREQVAAQMTVAAVVAEGTAGVGHA